MPVFAQAGSVTSLNWTKVGLKEEIVEDLRADGMVLINRHDEVYYLLAWLREELADRNRKKSASAIAGSG